MVAAHASLGTYWPVNQVVSIRADTSSTVRQANWIGVGIQFCEIRCVSHTFQYKLNRVRFQLTWPYAYSKSVICYVVYEGHIYVRVRPYPSLFPLCHAFRSVDFKELENVESE